jgi:hypothetical protein
MSQNDNDNEKSLQQGSTSGKLLNFMIKEKLNNYNLKYNFINLLNFMKYKV